MAIVLNGESVFGVDDTTKNTISDFYINEGGAVVEDGPASGVGSLTVNSGDNYCYYDSVYGLNANGDLYFKSGVYNFVGNAGEDEYIYGLGAWGNLYADGGSISIDITADSVYTVYGLYCSGNAYADGGSISIDITAADSTYYVSGLYCGDDAHISGGSIDIGITATRDTYSDRSEVDGLYIGDTYLSGGDVSVDVSASNYNTVYGAYLDCPVEVTGGSMDIHAAASGTNICTCGMYVDGDLAVESGSVYAVSASTGSAYGVFLDSNSGLEVSGGTVSATGGLIAIYADSVSYDGTNTVLYDTTPPITEAGTADGTVSDLSTVSFESLNYIDGNSDPLTYIRIGTPILSGLAVSEGTLSPTFDSDTYAYAVSVANGVTSLTVTPTTDNTNAAVTVNGTAVASGAASDPISLAVGQNTITVEVTAQDGATTQTYTATVTRARASSSGGGSSTASYTITATAGEGGSISPSGSASVASGKDKTYTVTADTGYEISDVLVDGKSVGAVSSYTFEDVKKAHTIAASFVKETVNPFSDVTADDWFYNYVLYTYENGLMNGTASGIFSPDGTMTRAMFVTVLYRLSGDTGSYTNTFSDVPSGEWYEDAAAWARRTASPAAWETTNSIRTPPSPANSSPRFCTVMRRTRAMTSPSARTQIFSATTTRFPFRITPIRPCSGPAARES